jgi:hypothetical protein
MGATRLVGAAIICTATLGGGKALAYEVQTHEELSTHAYARSVIQGSSHFPERIGLSEVPDSISKLKFPNDSGEPVLIRQLIEDGVAAEDQEFPVARMANHFYDPLYDSGLAGGAAVAASLENGVWPFASPDWALEDTGPISWSQYGIERQQAYSLTDAVDYYYRGLSEADKGERRKQLGRLFRTLGHVIHHVEDMGQPQHTRNDQHTPLDSTDPLQKTLYEDYTEEDPSRVIRENGSAPGYTGAVWFDEARKYWLTAAPGTYGGAGIAEFSNRNFVTAGTDFRLAGDGTVIPDRLHPRPVALASHTVPVNSLYEEIGKDVPCRLFGTSCLHGDMTFIATDVIDGLKGGTSRNRRAAAYSIFTADLKEAETNDGAVPVFTVNRFTFEAGYPYLIPRILAYSAGLIDYFFRGRIDVDSVEVDGGDLHLTVTNRSRLGDFDFPLGDDGAFEVYYEAQDGQRRALEPLNGTDTLAADLGVGETHELVFAMPSDIATTVENPFVVVFRGSIGEEEGVASRVFHNGPDLYVADMETGSILQLSPQGELLGIRASVGQGASGLSVYGGDLFYKSYGAAIRNGGAALTGVANANDTSVNDAQVFVTDAGAQNATLHVFTHGGVPVTTRTVSPRYYDWGGSVRVSANNTHVATTSNLWTFLYTVGGLQVASFSNDDISSQEVDMARDRVYRVNGGTIRIYDMKGVQRGTLSSETFTSYPCLAVTETRAYVTETKWNGFRQPRTNLVHIFDRHVERDDSGRIVADKYKLQRTVDISAFTDQPRSCSVDRARMDLGEPPTADSP